MPFSAFCAILCRLSSLPSLLVVVLNICRCCCSLQASPQLSSSSSSSFLICCHCLCHCRRHRRCCFLLYVCCFPHSRFFPCAAGSEVSAADDGPGVPVAAPAGFLLTGDTLFPGSCGRMDLAGSSVDAMLQSLSRLSSMAGDVVVLPGHNYAEVPYSTIAQVMCDLGMCSGDTE